MSIIHLEETLGNLVTQHPAGASVLERLGLDYCCGGRTTLADACAAAGLDAAAVVHEVLEAEVGVDASSLVDYALMNPAELADHIEQTHHAYLHAELPRLVELTAKIAAVHGERHPELIKVADLVVAIRDDLEPHMAREEMVLFPLIRRLAAGESDISGPCGGLGAPIARMRDEHEVTGDLLVGLRELTNGYQVPADGCATYQAAFDGLARMEADTHLHIHKENNVLFPAVDHGS